MSTPTLSPTAARALRRWCSDESEAGRALRAIESREHLVIDATTHVSMPKWMYDQMRADSERLRELEPSPWANQEHP